jgi:hypothetical protein
MKLTIQNERIVRDSHLILIVAQGCANKENLSPKKIDFVETVVVFETVVIIVVVTVVW